MVHLFTLNLAHPHHYVVSCHGDADIVSAPLIRRALGNALRHAGNRDVVADLCEIDFMDSSGAAPLVEADRLLHARGRRLWIGCSGAHGARFLHLLKLDGYFPRVPPSVALPLCNSGGHITGME
ncbi:STAS domain-containing protein [Streptomyces sp. PCS3-D2]|uniref:STAS domain-containing protein n=1 Tax=Streptomyces sp. PCS3-D2 TaxID=1460244 RepID=UPI0004450727